MHLDAIDQYRSIFLNEKDADVLATYALRLIDEVSKHPEATASLSVPAYPPPSEVLEQLGRPASPELPPLRVAEPE
jgi:hypothetical protein